VDTQTDKTAATEGACATGNARTRVASLRNKCHYFVSHHDRSSRRIATGVPDYIRRLIREGWEAATWRGVWRDPSRQGFIVSRLCYR